MKRSKLLSVLAALSVTASMLVSSVHADVITKTFTDDFSEQGAKIIDSSSNVSYPAAYTDTAHENFYSNFASVYDTTVGNSGYITYKVDGEITDFKIDVTWNNYANLGIWKVALSPDGNTWTEYEAYDGTKTVVTDKTKDENGTVTGSVSTALSELQDSAIPDLTVSVDSTQVALVQSTSTSKSWCYVMHFTPGAELAEDMKYLRITTPETGLDRWANVFARGIYNVSIDYIPGIKASVENSGSVQKGEPIKVNFSEKAENVPAPVVKKNNGVEVAVNYTVAEDGMSCTIIPQSDLEEGKYTVEFTGDEPAEGEEFGLNSVAEFTVVDLIPGDKVFFDDFGYSDKIGDVSKIYAASLTPKVNTTGQGMQNSEIVLDTCSSGLMSIYNVSDASELPNYALNVGPKDEAPYIIYKVNGNITGFDISVAINSTDNHSQYFSLYLSPDGETWTKLQSQTQYIASSTVKAADGWTLLKTMSEVEGTLPEGMNYIKIVYPTANSSTDSETGEVSYWAGWGTRRILNVSIDYNIPEAAEYEVTNGSFALNGEGVYTYTADFTSNKADVSASMIVAVYDTDGFVKLGIDNKQVTAGTPSEMTASVDVSDVTDPSFKVFFWNNDMIPLTDPFDPQAAE